MHSMKLTCIVFLPRINLSLKSLMESWNNHPISTEHIHTPNQLFIERALPQNVGGGTPLRSLAGTNLPTSHDLVQVPRSSFASCAVLKREVCRVNVLRDSSDFGMDLYHESVRIVGQNLTHGCRNCCA